MGRRVKAGDWLGPSGLCSTLADMVNKVQPGGLHCRVIATSGGGAPVLSTSRSALATSSIGWKWWHRGLHMFPVFLPRGS